MEAIESEPKRVITSARLGRFPTCVPTSAECSACSQTDRQTDRSADQAQHVEVAGGGEGYLVVLVLMGIMSSASASIAVLPVLLVKQREKS